MKQRLFSLAVLAIGFTSQTHAAGKPAHMQTLGFTSQPVGHYQYCKQFRSDCSILTFKTSAPKLTETRWRDLVEVNTYSNISIEPLADDELYNVDEHWAYPVEYGDC